jgi:hypothetical protein
MKKLLLVLLLASIIPAAVFAELQLGGVAMYKGDPSTATGVSVNDFTFGGEGRLKFGLLQGGVSALYVPSGSYSSLAVLTDIGASLDVLFFRFGAGLGPNFSFNFGSGAPSPASVGMNVKVSADVNLGNLALGLVGYWYADSFSSLGSTFSRMPWLGVTLLVKLF